MPYAIEAIGLRKGFKNKGKDADSGWTQAVDGVDLRVEGAEVEAVRICRINDETAHVASRRAIGTPIVGVLAWIGQTFAACIVKGALSGKTQGKD